MNELSAKRHRPVGEAVDGQSRIDWVDNLRAIGIFFVILGHLRLDDHILKYIYSFHMPLFFFISGYLYDKVRNSDGIRLIKKRLRTIIVPYFVFSAATYLFWLILFRRVALTKTAMEAEPLKPLLEIFLARGGNDWRTFFDASLWFLPCLFLTEIFFWYISKTLERRSRLAGAVVVSALLGYAVSVMLPFRMPWTIDIIFTAAVFYAVGYMLKNGINRLAEAGPVSTWVLLAATLLVSVISSSMNSRVDMSADYYGNFILFYLSSFSGIIFYTRLAQMVRPNIILSYIGRNTMVIFCLSQTVAFILRGIYYLIFRTPVDLNIMPLWQAVMLTAAVIIATVPVINIINGYLPGIIGRQKPVLPKGAD